MQKIIPCLWFDNQAEEAVNFYAAIFKDAKIGTITRYDSVSSPVSGMPEGSVLTIEFQLQGQDFLALNGGPMFQFSEAISFTINCQDQDEVDHFWEKLTEDGQEQPCGWLKDKFGLSWQVVPGEYIEMSKNGDAQKMQRVNQALFQMKKIDMNVLREAYDKQD